MSKHTDTEDVERTDNPIVGCVEGVLLIIVGGLALYAGYILMVTP